MKPIEQAAQECASKIYPHVQAGDTEDSFQTAIEVNESIDSERERAEPIIAAAMREACKPLQHQLRERTQWMCACGGTDCAGQVENERLRAALDVAEGALKPVECIYVATTNTATD